MWERENATVFVHLMLTKVVCSLSVKAMPGLGEHPLC